MPIASIDFEKGVVYDYEKREHPLGAIARLMLGNKRGNVSVQSKDNNLNGRHVPNKLEKALQVVRDISSLGIIKDYAVCGAVAAMCSIEPVLTYDLDIFFIPIKEGPAALVPIQAYVKYRGFSIRAKSILVDGIPIQFIPASSDLVREAVEHAETRKYYTVELKVVTAEYLSAIAIQAGRDKDKEHAIRLLEVADIDRSVLSRILESYGLARKFKGFEKQYMKDGNIDSLFRKKREWRCDLTKLPFVKKIEIVIELQKVAAGHLTGPRRRAWTL